MRRCYGCFQAITDVMERCPHCGYLFQEHEKNKWTLMPGTVLNGKYLVGKLLGEGGFGITYLAWDINMETRIAVKEYYPANLVARDVTSAGGNSVTTTIENNDNDFEKGLRRYVKEAAVLARFFDLPGIVSVKDFFYENNTAYIVMEFIDGISLKKVLEQNKGKLKWEESLQLVQPVISSLSVIHKNKLLHRDISPDNIMLDKSGRVKLIDFGAARYYEGDSERSMTVVLKHGYAPIEQYSRNGEQGICTDIYGVCAVLYRMITGCVPIEATERIREDKLVPIHKLVRKVPGYVTTAIEKGLSVLPENRQQSMEELYTELYMSPTGYALKAANKLYWLLRKVLIIAIIFLAFVAGIGVFYRINQKKIEDFVEKVETVFNETNEPDREIERELNEQEKQKSKADGSRTEEEISEVEEETKRKEQEIEKEDDVADGEAIEDISEETNLPEDSITDVQVEHGIMVVRDGILNGHEQSLTVGGILDKYSDDSGNWDGYLSQDGQIYIYYQGIRNESSFVIEFQVFSGDTFKVTGAAVNGEQMEEYSAFFQQILNEVGV